MPRRSGRNHMREHLAFLAARLMARDGIEDYALAKRKAAREAGMPETRGLPDNDEIDTALRSYRELYQQDHPDNVRELRQLALELMDELQAFGPHLTGTVLKGSAGRYAPIQLQLFTDSVKSVEHYLLNHGIQFQGGESRLYLGSEEIVAPTFSFQREGIEVKLTVLSLRDQRAPLKTHLEGKPIERARREAVARLIDQNLP